MYKSVLFMLLVLATHIANSQIISIDTRNTSFVLLVKNEKVYQLHYGSRIVNKKGLENLELTFGEAYSSFGSGDSDEVALVVQHEDGTLATDLFYVAHESVIDADKGTEETIIKLKDSKKPLTVELHYLAYQDHDVIAQWSVIRNNAKKPITLEQYASSSLSFRSADYYLTKFHGSWAKEMILSEEKLSNGIKTIETKRGVRTTEYENPSFVLSMDQTASDHSGEVVMGALAWTGNYKISFQVNDKGICRVISGINPFVSEYKLEKQSEFITPQMIWTYSNAGKNKASINLHRWARAYNLKDGDKINPIVLNSWEGAYFKFDEAAILSMIEGAAEMGVEIFVLDDGWFGNKYPRNSDKAGLGDWQVNTEKLPNGIGALIDHTEKYGMKFGIWVEPEMVNPKSELAEDHPDWIIQRGNDREYLLERNQLLLDLSNPKVQDFVFDVVDDVLTDNPGIVYIKWDANRHVENFGSTYLGDDKQSHLWVDYTRGYESVLDRLTKKYPDVIFQACSSGGGRVDFGVLKYSNEFWASDNTDPLERLFIQWGTNHIYPPIGMGSHVTKSPNHQTHRVSSLKFRFDVAYAGRLGIELSPSIMNENELEFSKNAINTYKEIRPIIQFGDLYRLQSPYDEDGYLSLNYVTQDQDKAVLLVYSHELHRRDERNLVRLRGLDPGKLYKVTEINNNKNKSAIQSANEGVFSGEVLMNIGLKVDMKHPSLSASFLVESMSD